MFGAIPFDGTECSISDTRLCLGRVLSQEEILDIQHDSNTGYSDVSAVCRRREETVMAIEKFDGTQSLDPLPGQFDRSAYLNFGDGFVTVDGDFTPDELRELARLCEEQQVER